MIDIIAFIILIGVLITVHEFGHYAVGKLCGVKVEVFSIGFGKPIISTHWGETEYRIAWIPFGGYVRFLGQMPSDEPVKPEDRGRALNDKSPLARICISAAGPIMNLLLPFAIIIPYIALAEQHKEVVGGQVGALDESMPAWKSGMREGDIITQINGVSVHAFWQIKDGVESFRPDDGSLSITVQRDSGKKLVQVVPREVKSSHEFLGFTKTDYLIGYQPDFLNNSIALKYNSGPLYSAGLRTFDRVLSVNGQDTPRFIDVVRALKKSHGETSLTLVIERTGPGINTDWSFIKAKDQMTILVPLAGSRDELASSIRHSGTCVTSVAPDSPAGSFLKRGDCLLSVEGESQSLGAFLIRRLRHKPGDPKKITWLRNGQVMSDTLTLKEQVLDDPMAGEVTLWRLGFSLPVQVLIPASKVVSQQRFGHGWYEAKTQVPREMEVILRSLGGMFSGNVSPRQLSGPLTIFHLAGSHARAGLDKFLRLMALLSLSIGLFNLLPIPLLDGGHILVAGVELVTRRPMSEQMQARLQYVGLVFILAIFLFALGNDAVRSWRLSHG